MEYWTFHTSKSLLGSDEVLITSQYGVALYDGQKKTEWNDGKLMLSTHHLFFQSEATTLALPLENIARAGEPPTTTRGFAFSSDKIVIPLPGSKYVRASFRKKGMEAFFEQFAKVLQSKSWRTPSAPVKAATPNARQGTSSSAAAAAPASSTVRREEPSAGPRTANMIGIAGVMKASADSAAVGDTFRDIDDVMKKASTLVQSVRQLKERAAASGKMGGDGSNDEDVLALESIEATLGLGTMVSASTASSNKQTRFHEELATELHAWMTHPKNARVFGELPHVPLIELFSLYNRARSGDLVSPDDVLMACRVMNKQSQSRYALVTLSSGRMALQNKDISVVLARLVPFLGPQIVNPKDESRKTKTSGVGNSREVATTTTFPTAYSLKSVSDIQVAKALRVAVPVAKDVLDNLVTEGYLCESDAGYGCCAYYWNVFVF